MAWLVPALLCAAVGADVPTPAALADGRSVVYFWQQKSGGTFFTASVQGMLEGRPSCPHGPCGPPPANQCPPAGSGKKVYTCGCSNWEFAGGSAACRAPVPGRLTIGSFASVLCPATVRPGVLCVTVFRRPISRLVSAYFYCRESNRMDALCGVSELPSWAKGPLRFPMAEFMTFARHWGSFTFRQLQVEPGIDYLAKACRRSNPTAEQQCRYRLSMHPAWLRVKHALNGSDTLRTAEGRSLLPKVIAELPQRFPVIGLLSNTSQTLAMVRAAFGIPQGRAVRQPPAQGLNVQKFKLMSLTKWLSTRVERNTELKELVAADAAIYGAAEEQFAQQWARFSRAKRT